MSKDFYCPYCEKITKHFEKSWQEVYAGDGKKWEAFGMIMDMTGTSTLCKYAMNIFYWRCSVCGYGTCRKYNGEIDHLTYNF